MVSRIYIVALLVVVATTAYTQQLTVRVRVSFTDKDHNTYSVDEPWKFFSERALVKKKLLEVNIDVSDLPVSDDYLDSIRIGGARVICCSKWFNSAIVECTPDHVSKMRAYSFVKAVEYVSSPIESSSNQEIASIKRQKYSNLDTNSYGKSLTQVAMLGGMFLHENNYLGQGILVAVLDAGFNNADIYPVFDSVRVKNNIVATRDIVEPGGNVFAKSNHGTSVLSLMAGNVSGLIKGTAPEASYLLLRTEEVSTEEIVEEDYWVAGAEFADSMGADVLNSSLGYNIFDDNGTSHTHDQLNGKTARVTLGADIAVSKGMVVVVSAGNEGRKPWRKIVFPADGRDVITVGAVNTSGSKTSFSSVGYTADGRVKPEIVALGERPYTVNSSGKVSNSSNGTSFSAPLVAGLVACLCQAFPRASPAQIKEAIITSSSQYTTPDSLLGYGIPNFKKAFNRLEFLFGHPAKIDGIHIYPNPSSGVMWVTIHTHVPDTFEISIVDVYGRSISKNDRVLVVLSETTVPVVIKDFENGMYLVKVVGSKHAFSERVLLEW